MFEQITKINGRNEEGIALIKLEDVNGACQQPKHITRLYDDNGDLVSENEDEPRFALFVGNQTYVVSQAEYERVKALITK